MKKRNLIAAVALCLTLIPFYGCGKQETSTADLSAGNTPKAMPANAGKGGSTVTAGPDAVVNPGYSSPAVGSKAGGK